MGHEQLKQASIEKPNKRTWSKL